MNITGIIAEYNPLHNGHMYHIEMCKNITQCDALICVMSGNFVQRGSPAIIDKWNRTKMALNCGADLILELPVIYSLSSAEFFSFGAISLLNSLSVVNNICFGSECGNINDLTSIAQILNNEPIEYKNNLKHYLNCGYPYPVSRNKALCDYDNNINNLDEIVKSPNNILGIEYIKSILNLDSNITPYTIKRYGHSHNNLNISEGYSSATAIRKCMKGSFNYSQIKNNVPNYVNNLIYSLKNNNYDFPSKENMFNFIKYKHLNCKYSDLENIPDASEGLHNRIYKSIEDSNDYNELIFKIKSKRYTFTRINRILSQYFIGFDSYDTENLRKKHCPYARVLGFNNKGLDILREIKLNSKIPIISKMPKNYDDILSLEIQSTKAYSLINKSINWNDDYLISPIKLI